MAISDSGGPAPTLTWTWRGTWTWRAETLLVAVTAVVHIGGTALVASHQRGVPALDPFGVLLLAVAPALLPARHRWPVATYAGVFGGTLAYVLWDYPGGPIWLPLMITFGTVLVRGHRAVAYVSMPVGYLAFVYLPAWMGQRPTPTLMDAVGVGTWMLLLVAASELVRNRRAYLREAGQRRLEAERSRMEEGRRQASEQRLTIARELHDVLAHSISLINVQAGVALELMDRRPDQARSSLVAIKQTSKDALVEVQTMLRTLREPDEGVLRAPAPGLRRLSDLTERATATGLLVTIETVGEPVAVPASVDLAAYRIVQEALTNAVRHSAAKNVTVKVGYCPGELAVEVTDDGVPGAASSAGPAGNGTGGNGIRGMRERAMALGGELAAGARVEGGFRVRARLPLQQAGAAS